ncbi:MAG: estradiol 17-beta-dehydrogenase [Bacteroidetes bacterium OLB9]|nr:MAG: estradiol 17-beta-dehydrogenase [Bacteroidetes bacterium OLB9]
MKTVFITGVSTGIGFDALQRLVADGYFVLGSVRKKDDAARIEREFGDKVKILIFDVTDPENTQQQIASVIPLLKDHGLHCLINNAGQAVPGPLQLIEPEAFEYQMNVNVLSIHRITNLLLPYLGTDKHYPPGNIINISSVSGLFNSPYLGSYCISKHALESMTDIYRRELQMFGIKVSAIEPGPIKTQIWKKNKGKMDKFLDSPYGSILASADKVIDNNEKNGLEVSIISDTILKILRSADPKTRYLIHKKPFKFKLLKWIPDKTLDKLIQKTLAKKDNFRPV